MAYVNKNSCNIFDGGDFSFNDNGVRMCVCTPYPSTIPLPAGLSTCTLRPPSTPCPTESLQPPPSVLHYPSIHSRIASSWVDGSVRSMIRGGWWIEYICMARMNECVDERLHAYANLRVPPSMFVYVCPCESARVCTCACRTSCLGFRLTAGRCSVV